MGGGVVEGRRAGDVAVVEAGRRDEVVEEAVVAVRGGLHQGGGPRLPGVGVDGPLDEIEGDAPLGEATDDVVGQRTGLASEPDLSPSGVAGLGPGQDLVERREARPPVGVQDEHGAVGVGVDVQVAGSEVGWSDAPGVLRHGADRRPSACRLRPLTAPRPPRR